MLPSAYFFIFWFDQKVIRKQAAKAKLWPIFDFTAPKWWWKERNVDHLCVCVFSTRDYFTDLTPCVRNLRARLFKVCLRHPLYPDNDYSLPHQSWFSVLAVIGLLPGRWLHKSHFNAPHFFSLEDKRGIQLKNYSLVVYSAAQILNVAANDKNLSRLEKQLSSHVTY